MRKRDSREDASVLAARRKRERRRRTEQRNEEWDRFANLTHSLVRTPKTTGHDEDTTNV